MNEREREVNDLCRGVRLNVPLRNCKEGSPCVTRLAIRRRLPLAMFLPLVFFTSFWGVWKQSRPVDRWRGTLKMGAWRWRTAGSKSSAAVGLGFSRFLLTRIDAVVHSVPHQPEEVA